MTWTSRVVATGGSLALALGLSACSSGPPSNAKTEDFCTAYLEARTALAVALEVRPDATQWETIQSEFRELGEVGAPRDMPDQARRGFVVIVEAIPAADHAEAMKALDGSPFPGVSAKQDRQVDEFEAWAVRTCAPAPPEQELIPEPKNDRKKPKKD